MLADFSIPKHSNEMKLVVQNIIYGDKFCTEVRGLPKNGVNIIIYFCQKKTKKSLSLKDISTHKLMLFSDHAIVYSRYMGGLASAAIPLYLPTYAGVRFKIASFINFRPNFFDQLFVVFISFYFLNRTCNI